MTRVVYLDQNAISTLCAQLVDSSHNHKFLLQAIRECRIVLPLSYSMLDESLPIVKSPSSAKINAALQIFKELFVQEYFIKSHHELLFGDITAYATDSPLPTRKIEVNNQWTDLFDPKSIKISERLIEEIQQRKSGYQNDIRNIAPPAMDEYRNDSSLKVRGKLDFDKIWEDQATKIACSLAINKNVLTKCQERRIEGLLKIPSVRTYAGYRLSFDFSVIRGKRIEGNDFYDHCHVVQASAAHIFVTNDRNLTEILNRIPYLPYVVSTLENFIKWVAYGEPNFIDDYFNFYSEEEINYAKFC